MKNKIIPIFVFLLCILNINTIYASHTHTDDCYNGTIHHHSEKCYTASSDYRVCGGQLNWEKTDTIIEKCPNCDFIGYSVDVYQAICHECGNTYIDYVQTINNSNQIHYCGDNDGVRFTFNQPNYPKGYPRRKNTTDTMSYNFSNTQTICGKEEEKYYSNTGNIVNPICDQIAISVEPNIEVQTGSDIDLSIKVTYLDGHISIEQPAYNDYNPNKNYSNEKVTLGYQGKVGNAYTTNALITYTTITTTNNTTNNISQQENNETTSNENNVSQNETINNIVENEQTNETSKINETKNDKNTTIIDNIKNNIIEEKDENTNKQIKKTIIITIILFILSIVGIIYKKHNDY